MRKRILYIIGWLLICNLPVRAQDPYFTQNLYHSLYLNAAYAGYGSKLEATVSYRNQWRNESLPSYRTIYASASAKAFCFSNKSYLAFGGYALSDGEFGGLIRNNFASLSVATGLQLSASGAFQSRLLMGLSAGIVHRGYNLSDPILFETVVTAGGNFDPLFGSDVPDPGSRLVEDIGVGLAMEMTFGNGQGIVIGASGQHLTSPLLFADDRIDRKFGANIVGSFSMAERLSLRVYSDFAVQGKSMRTHAGALFGIVQDIQNGTGSDDYGITGGVTLSIVGDEQRSAVLESISPVLQFNFRTVGIVLTKDFNISTASVAGQKGGMQFLMRFRIGEHKIRSQERLPKLCSEPCPLP